MPCDRVPAAGLVCVGCVGGLGGGDGFGGALTAEAMPFVCRMGGRCERVRDAGLSCSCVIVCVFTLGA